MNKEEKKAYMLLKSVIFHYHGLDQEEKDDLLSTAKRLDAKEELAWANKFIAKDYITAFDRAREHLNDIVSDYSKKKRVEYINMVWEANNLKGFVTEMETTAMLKLAKDWRVENELRDIVLNASRESELRLENQ